MVVHVGSLAPCRCSIQWRGANNLERTRQNIKLLDKSLRFCDLLLMADIQAQADTPDETPVVDPLDATKSQSGTNELAAYQAEKEAMLNSLDNDDEQGHESAEVEEEEEEQNADDTVSDEEAEEQSEEVSDEEEADEEEPEPEAKTKDRFRFKNADDQAVAAIAKAKGISLVEAARLYAGEPTTTKHQEAVQESQEARESVADVTAQIKDLQAQKKAKFSELNFDEAAELDEQIDALRDKRDELKVTEAREQSRQEQAEATKFYADYEKSEIKTVGLYPDAAVKTSPLAKEMARLEAEMLELGDPLYHSTDKPFILAKEAAKNLGIPMKKPGTAPVKKTVQHRPIQPAGGNARTTSADVNQALEQEIDQLDSLEAYERKFRQR